MSAGDTPPILTSAQAAEFERGLFGGDESAEWAAMRAAGRGVAEGVLRDYREIGAWPAAARILVLAGKGHNGGDALIAAAEILRRHPGAQADVVFAFGERPLRPLAARAWQELVQSAPARVRPLPLDRLEPAYAVSLDGVFGFQYRPPLPPDAARVLRWANALDVRLRAAVDLPSGLDEPEAFRADFTYATGAVKADAVNTANSGRLRFIDLGFFRSGREVAGVRDRVLTEAVLRPISGLRPARGDKRTYGHVFILGGSRSYPGAVLMNVLAALHSGVGLVTAFVPESLAASYAARAPEAIWVGWPETPRGGLALEGRHLLDERVGRASALAMGSGMDREPETMTLVREIAGTAAVPLLLDGDALQPENVAAAKGPLLLTPHAGEFKRVSGGKELREFCAGTGATVILKGPITRVSSGASGDVYHSFFGGPVLARGGSGDILAGLAAGQMAHLAASKDATPLLTAALRAAVWHGLAADALARANGQTSATVTQLVDRLPGVLRADYSLPLVDGS